MKRIEIILGLSALSGLTFSACHTQKKIVNAMSSEVLAANLPCFNARYQSTPSTLFGSGMGESLDGENAYHKASLESEGKISSQIYYLLNRIIEEYDKRAHLSGEQIANLRIAAGCIANTQLGRLGTACERDNTHPETGKTIFYLTHQVAVQQVIDAFEKKIQEDPSMSEYNSGELRTAAANVLKEAFVKP